MIWDRFTCCKALVKARKKSRAHIDLESLIFSNVSDFELDSFTLIPRVPFLPDSPGGPGAPFDINKKQCNGLL